MPGAHQDARSVSETRKTGLPPGLSPHRRRQRRTRICIAQCTPARDGIQADHGGLRPCSGTERHRERPCVGRWRWPSATQIPRARPAPDRSADRLRGVLFAHARIFRAWDRSGAVSHAAIAAVLRLEDVSAGERLAAFSLASFANREHRAWPGTPVAAARAGLSRSQYLAARDGLARRGLVEVDEPGGGRGRLAGRLAAVRASRVRGATSRSTRACSRRCSATAARAGQRGCCWPPWPLSPTSTGGRRAVDRRAPGGGGDGRQHLSPSQSGAAGRAAS